MKKLFVVLIAVVFASCSQDQIESTNPVAETSLSVLDGKLLSFKDDKSFIKEYSELSELKSTKEIQRWILKKGHSSLLNGYENVQDSIIDDTKIIYSNALKAILNVDSKFKINGKVIWLNGNNFYILAKNNSDKSIEELVEIKNDLEVYGNFKNEKNRTVNSTSKLDIPAVNGTTVTYMRDGADSKRYYLILFNESITLNGVFSSKIYVKSIMQYRSCSFWRCTWKEDLSTQRRLDFNVVIDSGWSAPYLSSIYVTGTQTLLLSTLEFYGPIGTTFHISGNITTYGFNGYVWSQTF